jgi:hypothetical protein
METFEPYDPEDLDRLLSEKSFDELLPEEQAFALKHISSKEEYDEMRALGLSMADPKIASAIEPSARLKASVISAYKAAHAGPQNTRPGWLVWLFAREPWFSPANPGVRLACASLVLLLGVWWFFSPEPEIQMLAENKSQQTMNEREKEIQPAVSEDLSEEETSVVGESNSDGIPILADVPEKQKAIAKTEYSSPDFNEVSAATAYESEMDYADNLAEEIHTEDKLSRSFSESSVQGNKAQADMTVPSISSGAVVSKEKATAAQTQTSSISPAVLNSLKNCRSTR